MSVRLPLETTRPRKDAREPSPISTRRYGDDLAWPNHLRCRLQVDSALGLGSSQEKKSTPVLHARPGSRAGTRADIGDDEPAPKKQRCDGLSDRPQLS
jgi:hypothetical protein